MRNKIGFEPHSVRWNEEKISRVWAFHSSQDESYFSQAAGSSVLKAVQKKISLRGNVLDFGCGAGHFVELLLLNKIPCSGFDLSKESVDSVQQKFKGNPLFLGALHSDSYPTPFENELFDLVFFMETIEHLLPEQIHLTLKEIFRLTKKKGHIIVTTRNKEDLNKKKVICPDCGAIFHRKQHLSSFTVSHLADLITKAGFQTVFCKPVLFSISRLSWIRRLYAKYVRISGEKLPSLLYIGKK